MKTKNEIPAHLFFDLLDPSADIYIYQPLPSVDGYEEENCQSFTWEQILKESLKTLTSAERAAARDKIAGSLKRFLKHLESKPNGGGL